VINKYNKENMEDKTKHTKRKDEGDSDQAMDNGSSSDEEKTVSEKVFRARYLFRFLIEILICIIGN